MGWSVDEVRRRREALEKEDAKKKAAAAAKASTNTKAAGTAKSGGSTGVTAGAPLAAGLSTEKSVTAGAPLATGLSTAKAGTAKTGGTAGSKKTTTTATPSLGTRVLAQMDGTQTAAATAKTGKKLPTVQRQNQPEWLQTESRTPAAVVRGANESQKAAQRRRSGSEGVLAQGAQAIKDHTAKAEDEDKFSDFTRLNRWMDADPKHRTLVSLIRMGKSGVEDAAALGSSTGDNAVKAQKPYTDAELIAKGYSQWQIDEARQYIAEYDALPAAEKAVRRSADTWKGIGGAVASFSPQLGENLGTAIWNTWSTNANERALDKSLAGDERAKQLKDMITAVDMDYKPQYTDEQLRAMGYSQSEITGMRQKVAGTVTNESVDKDESVGYQLYNYGKQRTERAQAGMNPTAQVAMSIGTSAAENLAVAGISPALVLPVLSAQGGAEAMGQSIDKGESAGKTLVGGLAKFGAGWAINSVGAADLAKTMGSDYAKDTLAGKLADVVRSVADNGVLAQQYPMVANAVSGGIDNAMQAFVETYADKAIDAALGDAQAAEEMFSRDTFLQALESGLSGGASGALGGAVGTQLGKMRAALETADGQTVQRNEPSQSPAGDSSLREGALGTAAQKAEQTAVNDDPAVHTPAQNASIEEYKQSVDPGLAEYVDRVRAGETPEPYMVTETSDRMRDAMQQLTGLDKVGDRTLMDANAVKHITNRHAGGDGSADGTMKNSADVARAAYVLNHFDNAYLATRKADGYYTGSRKKAPIVIFEKKIDGSHIVVEAVCDTKKSKNFIVSEYLSSVGVPEKEIAKALQPSMDAVADPRDTSGTLSADTSAISEKVARALRSSVSAASDPELYVRNVAAANSATTESVQAPMDAASDPRHTSETLTAHSSADTTVSQRAGDVNGNRVENTGETVESAAVKELAKKYRVSDAAAESMSRNMPEGVGAEVYAPAAASLYRLGVNGEGESFAQALQMTGSGTLSGAVRQVLATGETGRLALEMAYTQGRGEAERYKETKAAELGRKPDAAALREDAGTLYNGDGTENGSRRAGDELIRLTAGANGLAAQRVTEGIKNRAKGLIQSGIGKVFYSGEADTATVLHETFHAANSWDSAGAQEMIDTFEHYLVKQNGMDSVMQLVESYLDRYEKAGQSLTYNQAMEEITADAMQSIFGSEESFRNYLRQQALEARQNASALGKCQRVMEKIGTMLEKVLADIKSLLVKEPTNAAARAAKTLTEQQLKDLQQLWFNHQADAGENYRAALEENGGANKNAADGKTAAEGEKYSIDPDYAEKIDEWDKDGRDSSDVFVLGSTGETLQGLGAMENDIFMRGSKINLILKEHPEMTLEEIKRIPEILDDPVMILTSQNKGRTKQNTRLVMFGDVKAQDGRPVLCVLDLQPSEKGLVINDMQKVTSAYTKDNDPTGFVRKSTVLYAAENEKRTIALLQSLGFQLPIGLQRYGSMGTIAYGENGVKFDGGVKFAELEQNTAGNKYQLDVDSEDVKYSLPEMASETEEEKTKRQMALTIRPAQPNAERTAKVSGQNWSGLKTQDVYKAIRDILTEFGIRDKTFRLEDLDIEFGYGSNNIRESANKQKIVSEKEYNDFALVQANIEEVLRNAKPLEAHADKKGKPHVEGMIVLASALQDGARIIPVRAELKLYDNEPTALYFAIAETTAQESRDAANKKRTGSESRGDGVSTTDSVTTGSSEKELDLQVRREPLLTQEAALPVSSERTGSQGYDAGIASNMETPTGSSNLSIFDYYRLVNHDANFTKYFSDEVAQKAESGMPGAAERLQARADAIEKDRNYIRDHGKYQLDVDSEDVEAAREAQMGSGRAASEAVQKVMKQAQNATVSDDSLLYIARKMVKASASRMDAKTIASRLAALRDYMNGGNVDWAQAHGFVLDMAQQIMEKSTKRNDALWKQYPELHQMEMSLEKGSKDYREVVYQYGSWAGATKELARHGVKLTMTKNGEVSRWDADFTELQGIGGGLLPTETPSSAADALEAMAAAHDAIRPTMESAYDSDWDAAKQELAMEIWGEYLGLPGVANESNAALRRKFGQQTKEMNEKARKHALALQAQVNLEEAKRRARNRQKMAKPYADATAKAKEHYAETEEKLREKIGAKERKLEQQAAIQREAERGRAREKVAIAKAKNEQRLAQMRESRDKDNTRRAIRKVTGELTKLYEHPKEGSYIPDYLLDKVMPVLQLANEVTGNRETAERLANWRHRGEDGWHYTPMQDTKTEMNAAVDGLRRGIAREMEAGDRANLEWEQSGLTDAIDSWLADVNDNREREIARLEEAIRNAQKLGDESGGIDGTVMEAHLNALQEKLDGYKSGGMAALSATELRGLRDILEQTAHIIKIDNVVVGATEDVMIDEFAEGVKLELTDAKGVSKKSGFFGKVSRALNSYKMNTMNIERMFERLGGYTHGGYLENLGKMLNDGQRKKTKILIEGTRVFDELTGPKHEKELYHFTHDLVDIGLKDDSGKARKITHNQLAELALQLQNRQGVHHILHGGLTLENMEAKLSGDTELAKLDKATVRVGQLTVTDEAGNKLDAAALSQNEDAERRTLLEEVDKHLTDYDRAWMAAWKTLNARMTGYINETSMLLSGVKKATTENYIHINVDGDTNLEQNKGIRYDNSAANPGWLNHRVNSSKPILLVGLVQQAETSIENTAQYAGMAVPLRNAEKVLNSMQGGRTLFGTIGDVWGTPAREYMNNALADLCEVKDSRAVGDGVFAKLRSTAAAAALNANINVTLLQAASLPTAAAELGWGATGGAAVQFGKNILPWELTKIEQRMAEHGDELLAYRLRGTGAGEMASAEARKGFAGRTHDAARNSDNKAVRGVTRAADKVLSLWTAGIGKMDEITVAACWQGSESYVKAHPEEFAAGAEVVNSPEYWAAVNEKFEQVVEHTQPNYTTMQRTGFQRSDNAMVKALMMFSTQRQQNAQILTAAFEDYAAQNEWVKAREKAYREHPGAESKAALEEAQKAKDQAALRKMNAISSQVVQTAVIAALGVGVKFGLHRWQDLQDDNGDMTPWSVAADFVRQFVKSFGSNWTGVSEAMTAVDLATSGFTSTRSTISMNGIEVLNDVVRKIAKVYQLEAKDTSEMTEKQLDAYNAQMKEAIADMLGQFAAARGIPYANLKKQVQAVTGWMDTLANWNKEGGNFDSLPASATGQYDRLYNAYVSGDPDEAQAAAKKLDQMVQAGAIAENKMYDQLKTRLKKYDADTRAAAKAQMEGNEAERYRLETETIEALYDVLGIRKDVKEDAPKRAAVIDCVTGAVNELETEMLKGDSGDVYADLKEAADSWNARDVQKEYDRLVKAGRSGGTVKKKITEAVKPEYLAGSDADKQQLADVLLALTDADGKALYTEKTFTQWEKAAEKAAQAEPEEDPYARLR